MLFEADGDALIKKIAGYHQFHGVREAVRVTLIASATEESARVKEKRATYSREVGARFAQGGRLLAHAGLGQKHLDVLLPGEATAAAGDEQPNAVGGDGSQQASSRQLTND